MKYIINFTLIIILLSSCERYKPIYETKKTTINAKSVKKVKGSYRFILSFSDGESEYCSFEEYNKYKIGDTLYWKREKNIFNNWILNDQKQ